MSELRRALSAVAGDVKNALLKYFNRSNVVLHRVNLNYYQDVLTAPSCGNVKDAFITTMRRQFVTDLAIAHRGELPYMVKDLPLFEYDDDRMAVAFDVVALERHGAFYYYLDINWDKAVQVMMPSHILRSTFLEIEAIKRSEGSNKLPDHTIDTEILIPDHIDLGKVLFANKVFQESFIRLLAVYGRSYDSLSTEHIPSTRMTRWKYTY